MHLGGTGWQKNAGGIGQPLAELHQSRFAPCENGLRHGKRLNAPVFRLFTLPALRRADVCME